MLSLLQASSGPFFICFADLVLILLFLSASSVHGASLREHRLRGSEGDSRRGEVLQAPDADMLKALQYIESLRQRTDSAPSAGHDEGHMDDAEKLRVLMLRLASNPMQSKDEEEEEEEEDKSKELLQAVLSTLEQTSKTSLPRAQQRQQSIRPHRKLPLMFEDEEEEEGDGDEEEDTDLDHQSPFKRTNENVEEKYTPQNLATLQSVFDELDKLTAKEVHKRQDEEDYDEEEDNGLFGVRNVAYEDWGPLQEEEEEEEEEEEDRRDDNQEVNRDLNYVDDNDEDEEEEDDDSYLVKRSKEPEDMANMVDYYLLKVLERTEEEEQKREAEEEERKRDSVDPQTIYQLIQVSQKYQIPPEDLLDMLKTADVDPDQEVKSQKSRTENKFHTKPEAKVYKTEDQRTDLDQLDQLDLLGFRVQDRDPVRVQKKYKSSPSGLHAQPPGRSGERLDDYDEVNEDQLAAYLAAQMLSESPKVVHRDKTSQKRDRDGQNETFEQVIQTFLDSNEKRRSEGDGVQGFDSEPLLKLLRFLKAGSEETGEKTTRGA